MMQPLNEARQRVRLAARNGAVTAVALVLFLIGAGFGIAAAWMLLEREWGELEATGAMAFVFLLLAGLVLLMRRPTPPAPPPPPPPRAGDPSTLAILVEAFLLGQRLAERSQRRPADDD